MLHKKVERLRVQHQRRFPRTPRGEGLLRRHPRLRWFASASSQSHSLGLQSLLPEHPPQESPPTPPPLPQGRQVQGAVVGAQLHVPRRGECRPGKGVFFHQNNLSVNFPLSFYNNFDTRRSWTHFWLWQKICGWRVSLRTTLVPPPPQAQTTRLSSVPLVQRSQDPPLHPKGTRCLRPSVLDRPPLHRATTKTTTTSRKCSQSSSQSQSPRQPRWFLSSSSTPQPGSRVNSRLPWRTTPMPTSRTTTESTATVATMTAVGWLTPTLAFPSRVLAELMETKVGFTIFL